MKILLIHGQNHKGSTYHIGRILAEHFPESDISEFFLPRDLEHFCTGCYSCIVNEETCPFYAEKKRIMEAVEKADLLIFTTPTYCMRASAPMKAFIDLTFTYWMVHKPRACMFSKKAVVISTAAGTGVKSAIKDIKNALFYRGIPYIKEYGIAVQAMNWEQVSDKSHSPILLGIPDADILSFDGGELHKCGYEETESYQVTEMFINNREALINRLLNHNIK